MAQDLAALQALKKEVERVLYNVCIGLGKETEQLNVENYRSKKIVIAGLIELYLNHLEKLRKKAIPAAVQNLDAEIRRWDALQRSVKSLQLKDVHSFKTSMEHLLRELGSELNTVLIGLDSEITKLRAAQR